MSAILLMIAAFAAYILAYNTYGRFLARKIFNLDPGASVPSADKHDGVDYVPTPKGIIFGHHFTSIAGTGPIVGPAIGVIWGWLPALAWVLLGSIFMGAVHDFGALILSLRNQGYSIADITSKYINRRVRLIFYLIVFFALLIVIAIFGLVIAVIFKMYPQAVLPVWLQIPIAMTLGVIIYRRGGDVKRFTFLAVVVMYITVVLGRYFPLGMPAVLGIPSTGVWTIILLAYAFFASTLPVTTLLQPRDYINAWQLFIAMGLLIAGVITAGFTADLKLVAPAYNPSPAGAPPILPFLFITIACGAISGFHSLVSSGTSSKQIANETDAQLVGYGSMLFEAALATLVIIATTAGIGLAYKAAGGAELTGIAAWKSHYGSWAAAKGLGSKVGAFVNGAANMIATTGLSREIAVVIMGVFVASFAGTTLDTATRIQRYVVSEIMRETKFNIFSNRYAATAFAVITAVVLAFATGADGKGAMKLWPIFGAVNQLLAALALLLLSVYLKRKGGLKYLVSLIPCVVMLGMTTWSLSLNQRSWIINGNRLLAVLNAVIMFLALWMVIESFLALRGKRGPQGLFRG